MSYDPGDPWAPKLEVRNSAGVLVDATVDVQITAPDGTVSSPVVVHTSTGVYTTTALLTSAGQWQAKWTVTGTVTGVETQYAYVRRLGANVISVEDVKARLNKSISRTVDDSEIEAMLDAALAEYEEWVGPLAGPVTESHNGGVDAILLRSPHVTAVTSASYADGTSIDVANLNLDPVTGIVYANSTLGTFTRGSRNVTITYTAAPMPAHHRETVIADVAGYFEATQRGPSPLMDEGYADSWRGSPMVLFPRIRALAAPVVG